MSAPPLEVGAVKATTTCPFPAVAKPMVGAPGTVLLGVLLVEELELPPPHATNCNKAMTMSAARKPCFILSVPSCDQKEGSEILIMTLIELMVDDNALFMHQNKFPNRSIAYPNK